MTFRLQNKLFISTRPKSSSGDLRELLNREGAAVLELPLIEIKAAEVSDEELKHIHTIDKFHWIVFTSPNGVKYFFELLKNHRGNYHLPETVQHAVIGEKTESILNSYGFKASFVNPGNIAEDFAEPFLKHIHPEKSPVKIFLPLSNLARTVIQDKLKEAAFCTRVNVYQTIPPKQVDLEVLKRIKEGRYDMLIFTSPSGIRHFLNIYPEVQQENIRLACIGKVTYHEAVNNGFQPLATAEKSSAEGIFQSIINYYISEK